MSVVHETYATKVATTRAATRGLKLRASTTATSTCSNKAHAVAQRVQQRAASAVTLQISGSRSADARHPVQTQSPTSSMAVGMKVNTMARNMTAMDRVPRSSTCAHIDREVRRIV